MIVLDMMIHIPLMHTPLGQLMLTPRIKTPSMIYPQPVISRLLARIETHAMLHTRISAIWHLRIPFGSDAAPVQISLTHFAGPVEGEAVVVEMGLVAERFIAGGAGDFVGVGIDDFFNGAVGMRGTGARGDFYGEACVGGEGELGGEAAGYEC
jgi:hypothetical protein